MIHVTSCFFFHKHPWPFSQFIQAYLHGFLTPLPLSVMVSLMSPFSLPAVVLFSHCFGSGQTGRKNYRVLFTKVRKVWQSMRKTRNRRNKVSLFSRKFVYIGSLFQQRQQQNQFLSLSGQPTPFFFCTDDSTSLGCGTQAAMSFVNQKKEKMTRSRFIEIMVPLLLMASTGQTILIFICFSFLVALQGSRK